MHAFQVPEDKYPDYQHFVNSFHYTKLFCNFEKSLKDDLWHI